MPCNGICETRFGARGLGGPKEPGWKVCKPCQVKIKWEGTHCPCCNLKLCTSESSAIGSKRSYEKRKKESLLN